MPTFIDPRGAVLKQQKLQNNFPPGKGALMSLSFSSGSSSRSLAQRL
eukprot:CAMPEP_0174709006 /NCGR_PEP_ID=MMETSP1094-20130205/11099_1 /TAXON_ID=156173 /ORGANISM="Chrysochromulina brevifilum, Strain UTEX LB 985" /LENGTH=46 /DNA_ID= /DNA_START= /DNA_END= /DNA_ORIENTATION=